MSMTEIAHAQATDSIIVSVHHAAADAGPIRIALSEGSSPADSPQVYADSVLFGEWARSIVIYPDVSSSHLFLHLYYYDIASELIYGASVDSLLYSQGGIFTLSVSVTAPPWIEAVNEGGTSVRFRFVIVEDVEHEAPTSVARDISIYPNPATERTRIEFDARQPTGVTIEVVDVLGRVVTRDGFHATAGTNSREVFLDDLSAGVYFIRIRSQSGPPGVRSFVVR